jgi:hypothetical protein
MKIRFPLLLVAALLFASGCSALPGLRVLTGQDATNAVAERSVESDELVMADKSGTTDPALIAAADRIEAANGGNVDIVEIRQDTVKHEFDVYMLYQPDPNGTQQDNNNAIRRAIELTWQGTMQASRGSDVIRINIVQPQRVPTLDKGPSFVGFVVASFAIDRPDALAYLQHRPNTLTDFITLITDGKLKDTTPQNGQPEFYSGQPNHPVFMLASMAPAATADQQAQSDQNGQNSNSSNGSG